MLHFDKQQVSVGKAITSLEKKLRELIVVIFKV